VDRPSREEEWAIWMRAAIAGDAGAYRRFLEGVTPYVRAMARRRFARSGDPGRETEDLVQEVLLAIHLKRTSWDQARPIGPWISAISRNKIIDALRRHGRKVNVPIEDVIDTLASPEQPSELEHRDIEVMLARLKGPQRNIVQMISVTGVSVRETATRLEMTEGAVRVALHRALKSLAALYRSDFR
jgi:RNA polymerase sigma factor (sigma-70 family)